MLLGIKWYQFARNDDVWRLTKQPKLTAIIQLRQLTLFGHFICMDDNADAKRILLASPPADWRRQPGHPASRGSAPSKRIWNDTTLRSPKQQIWLRTALCGGWCRRMALRNLRVACQKWRRRRVLWLVRMFCAAVKWLGGSSPKWAVNWDDKLYSIIYTASDLEWHLRAGHFRINFLWNTECITYQTNYKIEIYAWAIICTVASEPK